jgi:hypothetical protein
MDSFHPRKIVPTVPSSTPPVISSSLAADHTARPVAPPCSPSPPRQPPRLSGRSSGSAPHWIAALPPYKFQSRCWHDLPPVPPPRAEVPTWMPPPPEAKQAWRSNVSPHLFRFFPMYVLFVSCCGWMVARFTCMDIQICSVCVFCA